MVGNQGKLTLSKDCKPETKHRDKVRFTYCRLYLSVITHFYIDVMTIYVYIDMQYPLFPLCLYRYAIPNSLQTVPISLVTSSTRANDTEHSIRG